MSNPGGMRAEPPPGRSGNKGPSMRQRLLGAAVCWLALVAAAAADDQSMLRAREAGAAMARANVDQAISLYTQALADKTLPNDRRAVILSDRGVAHARRQSPKDAIEDFNRAIQLYPEYAAVYNNRGTVLLGIGAVREAMKDFERALVLAPGYAAAFSNRAGAHMRLGEIDQAVADYTKAIALVPGNPAAFTGRGRAHIAALRPQSAIRDFTRAVALDARFSSAYRGRAEAKMAAEAYDDAIEDFSRAIAFESRNANLYLLRGGAYLEAGNAEAAVKDFTTAIEISPQNARAHVARGFAHAKAQAYEAALNDFGRAIELEPRSPKAFAYRAWTYRQQQQPELGLRDVDRALRLDGDSAEAFWARGEIHEAQGRVAQAIADLRKAVALDPEIKEAGRALARLGVNVKAPEGEVADAGRDGWRVFRKGRQYVARNDRHARLEIDIEMLGKGSPRILEWDVKQAPLAGIGVMRFYAGTVDGPQGPEDIEQIAIADLQTNKVIGVEMHRRGDRIATLTWGDGKVSVASADGTRDELVLREAKPKEPPAPPPKRYAGDRQGPSWPPWGGGGGRKPKSLFDLIFGN
jgi:tetratricopeptide (TPR) repeat protein